MKKEMKKGETQYISLEELFEELKDYVKPYRADKHKAIKQILI